MTDKELKNENLLEKKEAELLSCETLFGKDYFWNELETIVIDGIDTTRTDKN